MLFPSAAFLIFAALFFALWPIAKRRENVRYAYLVGASFLFYGWWDWRFLFLILASGVLDFLAGLGMRAHPRARKAYLALSLVGNVGSLAAFKYSGFLAANLAALLEAVGLPGSLVPPVPRFLLILPVGISFYTFQSMSYTIDIYRGRLEPTRNPLHFFAYLALFPQLVAGPIVRAADLLPQLRTNRRTSEADRWLGLQRIVHGFFKKVVIADGLAWYVADAFGSLEPSAAPVYWWLITAAFAVQIYCDFSGYSDIARGLAKWMGYDFLENFNHPYVSSSLREFWTRWHISLSTWFRDYVYLPLGGSRSGPMRSAVNLWITMLVSGLWHGAAWTFVAWGACHAFFLSVERWTRWPERLKKIPGGRLAATGVVLVQVLVGWVFFRAETMAQATSILRTMFSWAGGAGSLRAELGGTNTLMICGLLFVVAVREAWVWADLDRRLTLGPLRTPLQAAALVLMIVASVYLRGPGSAFIYFQF